MGRAARLEVAQTMSFQDLGDQNKVQVILDQPEHDGGGKHSKGQLESLVPLTSVQTQSGRICLSGQSRRSKRWYDTGKNRMEKTLSRQAGSSRSWSGEENIERAPTDRLIEDNMVSCRDNASFEQPIQLVLEGEGSFSEPISMLGSPENGSSTKSNEDSSEGSLSGLTLTSKSLETPEDLEGNGSEFEKTLVRSPSINEEKADFSPLALDQSDRKHSNDGQLHLPTSVSGEASSTLYLEQEPPLQHRLSREVRLSSTSQKVKSSLKPGLPPHLDQASAEADRLGTLLTAIDVKDIKVDRTRQENAKDYCQEEKIEIGNQPVQDDCIQCCCYFPDGSRSGLVNVHGTALILDVRKHFLSTWKRPFQPKTKISNYTIQLGNEQVLHVDSPSGMSMQMKHYKYVMDCMKNKTVARVHLVEKRGQDLMDSFPATDTLNTEEVMQRPLTFIKRSYLHIHIIECWLNEGALEERFQDGINSSVSYYNIIACLYHGGEKLVQSNELSTTFVLGCTNPRWNQLLTFPILLYDLPQEVRLNLALYHGTTHNTDLVGSRMVGWTNFCFVDENGVLKAKKYNLQLWKDPPFYSCGTFSENTTENFCGVLSVELDYNAYTICLQQREDINDENDEENDPPTPTDEELDLLDTIISTLDVITPPTEAQKHVLWQFRHALLENSRALPKFLMSVPWSRRHCVLETHRILAKWKPLPPFYALQLLGPQFGDKMVRDYAVDRLRALTEEEFQLILIQLVQALVYEPYNNSSLLQLLLERAANWTVGHHLFWLVKTGLQVPFFQARFQFVLEELLRCCKPEYVEELIKQDDFVATLIKIANSIKPIKSEARKGALHKMLSKIQFIEPISLPLNPKLKVNGFEVEKCKYMDSKKLPLWLVFKNADNKMVQQPIYTMFKAGDDLRQDMLTLQLMKIMEKIWSKSNLDLRMSVYGCVSTGLSDGFLEIVRNAETLSNIALKHGGGAKAVFRVETLQNWLVSNNRTGEEYNNAVDNFVRSCAAYCVATCILGIGDRHNDNVMIKKTGEFFHIDFGHILGHFKSKFGIKRERARFVFTPDMAYVMGGIEDERFKQFQDLCGVAFNKLRESAPLFLNLTHLMVSSGIPEIATPQNVYYVRDVLVLELSEEDAKEKFNKWIFESLQTTATQVNYAIHTWAHGC